MLTQIGTAVTWVFELTWPLVPLALWFRSTADRGGRLRGLLNRVPIRAVYVTIGLTMHVTIFLIMEVGPFSWVTLAYYPCLFRPAELTHGWRRVVARLRREPAAS